MIKNDSEIEIIYNDIPIKGIIVFKNRRAIGLEIVSPYNGLNIFTATIPIFAMKHSSYLDENGNIKEDRKEELERILLNLFLACKVFEKNKLEIKKNYNEIKRKYEKESANTLTPEQFSQQKRELKKELKTGKISNIQYQKKLAIPKKKLSNYDYTIYTMRSYFLNHIEKTYNIKFDTEVLDQLIKKFLRNGNE